MTFRKPENRGLSPIVLIAFGMVCILNGCLSYTSQVVSEPHIENDVGWEIKRWTWGNDRFGVIFRSDLSISVTPHNGGQKLDVTILPVPLIPIPYGEKFNKLFFVVSLAFDRTPGYWDGAPIGLEFNPSKVALRLADGSILLPAGFARPNVPNGVCHYYRYSEHDSIIFYGFTAMTDQWLNFRGGKERDSCFDLFYEITPPSPWESFSVTIKGLKKNKQDILVPPITFKKGHI